MFINKNILAIAALLLLVQKVFAQQDPQFTQFQFNQLVYNPAFAGTTEALKFTLFNRNQWVASGFENAPVTQTFSANTPLKDGTMGAGIHILNDKAGLERNFSLLGSYAYHLDLKSGKLGMGIQLGFKQYRVNQGDIKAYDKQDPLVNQGISAPMLPEVGIGFLYRDKDDKFYAGISSMHLTQSKIKYTNEFANSKLLRHFYLNGGYNYRINTDYMLKPALWLNYVAKAPFQAQLNVTGEYKEMVWLGIGYRSGAALTFNFGVNADKISEKFKEKIQIGYSFDYVMVSKIPKFKNAGSHEIFITYMLSKKEKTHIPKFKRLE
ncbi:MAG: type IX secretion system membrane protein PorP/SprF [Opitutaceae bacterium]|nr:type IX secretion system membrane protein PorP/SprF [Cytophagales bacterium]